MLPIYKHCQLCCSAVTHKSSMQVSPGDLVVTEKLRYVDVNQQIKISRVLMLGSRYESIIGRPLVPGAYVTAAIEVSERYAHDPRRRTPACLSR